MKAIDTHAHVFSQFDDFDKNARYLPNYSVTVEDYLAQLDKHGFSQGVLIQPSFLGTNNQYMIAAIAKYPDRLKGIAVVEPTISDIEIQHLHSCGIVGSRLNLFGTDCPDLTEPVWQTFLTRLANAAWQLELHAPPEYLVNLLPMLTEFAMPIVIDHFGRIDPKKGLADSHYQQFLTLLNPTQHWIKVSGYYRLPPENSIAIAQKALSVFLDKGMTDHLLWGSDWPHTQFENKMSFSQAFDTFKTIIGNEHLVHKILVENNAKLFGF